MFVNPDMKVEQAELISGDPWEEFFWGGGNETTPSKLYDPTLPPPLDPFLPPLIPRAFTGQRV